MPRLTRLPAWIWCLIVGAPAIGAYFVVPHGVPANIAYDWIGAASALVIVVAVRRRRPPRPVIWYLVAAGIAAWFVGDVIFGLFQHVYHIQPFPSVADGFYLVGYPLIAAGLVVLIRGRTSGRDRAGLIDACILTAGVTLPVWVLLMKPVISDTELTTTGMAISLAYPAGTLLLVAIAARLVTTPGARTPAYRLLSLALLLQLAADVGYSVVNMFGEYEGGLVDVGWLGFYVLLAAAALHPSMHSLSEVAPDRKPRLHFKRVTLLAAATMIPPVTLIWQGVADAEVDWLAVATGSVVLFLLVMARLLGLLRQVQDQASQLEALARHDGLTGVPNRRAWDLDLVRALSEAAQRGTPAAVALLDLDHFKRYNDTHGHQAGDALLRQAAAAWRAVLREGDLLARYGGEEFAVLVGGAPLDEVRDLLDRLRRATPLGQTVSVGVAGWVPGQTPEELVHRADTALYEAKRGGRDRVVVDAWVPVTPPVPAVRAGV